VGSSVQGFAGPAVEGVGDCVEVVAGVFAQVGARRQVLAQQAQRSVPGLPRPVPTNSALRTEGASPVKSEILFLLHEPLRACRCAKDSTFQTRLQFFGRVVDN
jgi:hypothetical protein